MSSDAAGTAIHRRWTPSNDTRRLVSSLHIAAFLSVAAENVDHNMIVILQAILPLHVIDPARVVSGVAAESM